jgi:hypothetical protein
MEETKIVTEPERTRRMEEVENKLAKPLGMSLEQLFIETYNRLGTLEEVAQEWNKKLNGIKVSGNLLWYWSLRLRIDLKISRQAVKE